MKILLCSIGSRGDIQPFLVLGDYFSKNGHEVKVVSAKMYESLAKNYQVDYISFEGDYQSIMDDEQMKKAVGKNPLTIRKNLNEKVYPIIESSLQTFYQLSDWADIIVYHPKTMIDSIGFDFKEKLIKAYVIPAFTPTSAFANPLLEFLPFPKFLNRITYSAIKAMMNTVKTPVNNFRQKNNLPSTPFFLDTPIIYGISSSILNRPDDYPNHHHFTGFWLTQNKNEELSKEVVNFMSDNKEVLLITFGSMPYKSAIDINDFIKAIRNQFDLKILIVKAWGLKDFLIEENNEVMAIDKAPFNLLFPLANYVIHHGGAGTTATALLAGIPQMICPILHPFGDQFFWGKQIEKKGLGVCPIPLKNLTIKKLTNSVSLLINGDFKNNAKIVRKQIKSENGLDTALKIIESHFNNL